MKPTATLRSLARQAGLSLIELMVAITIGMFLLVGLVSVFSTSNQTYVELGRASQQIENGRFATQLLVDDISHAGYFGRYSQPYPLPGGLPDPCLNTAATLLPGVALPLQGYDSPLSTLPIPLTCLTDANHLPGTDILVVRRADSNLAAGDDTTIPNGKLTAGGVYIQTNADPTAVPIIKAGTGVSGTDQANFTLTNKDGTIGAVRKYHVHIYFIARCSVPTGGGSVCANDGSDDNGAPIPTLKRLELTADGAMSVVPLVEGIENLQIDYGIDTSGNGVPNGYVWAPALADWPNVVSVRINVLSRQIEPSGSSYTDTKTYDMGAGAGTVAPGGSFKRHVYNTVVRVVNVGSRRE